MWFIICVSCMLLALVSGAPQGLNPPQEKPHYDLNDAPALFEKFIKDYDKTYKDDADKQIHYEAFLKALKSINESNSDAEGSAWFDINEFADYTEEQWQKMRGLIMAS